MRFPSVLVGWLVVTGAAGAASAAAQTQTTTGASPGRVVQALEACPTAAATSDEARQRDLQSTILAAQQYGLARLNQAGDLRFGGDQNRFVVISFVGDLVPHAAELARLVDRPDAVVVCRAPASHSELGRIANELVGRLRGGYTSVGVGNGVVGIGLYADRRAEADALLAEFGAKVRITLGWFGYPDRDRRSAYRPQCELPQRSRADSALRWVVSAPLRSHSGGSFTANITLTNTARAPYLVEPGNPAVGVVTRVGGTQALAVYSGPPSAGEGQPTVSLRRGQRFALLGAASTASCDPTLGWALPPGRYEVIFSFTNVAGGLANVVSPRFPLTITADAPPALTPGPPVAAPPFGYPFGMGGPGATIPFAPPSTSPAIPSGPTTSSSSTIAPPLPTTRPPS